MWCFFQYKITLPDTGEVEIDESFGFQPYLYKMWNNFDISLCMWTAVHTDRHEQFLSWTHHFWILQPHLQPRSRRHTNLQQHAQTYVTWDKVKSKHYNCSQCSTCNTQLRIKKSPTGSRSLYLGAAHYALKIFSNWLNKELYIITTKFKTVWRWLQSF